MENKLIKISFNFYGLPTTAFVENEKEVEILMSNYWWFKSKDENDDNELTFWFTTSDHSGFFESLHQKKINQKTIYVRLAQEKTIKIYTQFDKWSNCVTPFPPFKYKPLVNKYMFLQGSSVQINQKAYCFMGVPYSGKSTIMNWLIEGVENCYYLSDDIVVLDQQSTFAIEPYPTTTGIREDSRKWFKSNNTNSKSSTISEVTGHVEYFDVTELYKKPIGSKTELGAFFILQSIENHGEVILFEKKTMIETKINALTSFLLPVQNIDFTTYSKRIDEIDVFVIKYDVKRANKEDFVEKISSMIL